MEIFLGIASTTHIDAHGERMAKEALDSMAVQIRTKYIPQLIEHDFNRQIGVNLYGEVIRLEDGEFALLVVSGSFEKEEERQMFPNGAENVVWQKFVKPVANAREAMVRQVAEHSQTVKTSVEHIDRDNIAKRLEIFLDSTLVREDGVVYHVKYLVASVGDLKIEVFPNDHNPPHFHVTAKSRNINASFNIHTFELIKGDISTKDVKRMTQFLKENPDVRDHLMRSYERMQQVGK